MKARLLSFTPAFVSALAVFLVVGWFNGRRAIFSPDRDEDYALIQVMLVRRGHPLYSETWSDQPPGSTWMMGAFTWLVGDTPEQARLSTALLLSAYAFGCFELCRRRITGISGYLGGIACVAALLLQSEIFRYGCAAMISLPAVLFVGLGWVVGTTSATRTGAGLAGVLVGLGLAFKPLGLPGIPGVLVGVAVSSLSNGANRRQALGNVMCSLTSCAACLALFYWPVFLREGGDTVYKTHEVRGPGGWVGLGELMRFLEQDAWLFSSGALGAIVLVLRRRAEALSLGLWLVAGALALSLYQPIWSHHRYLILVPMIPLFGLGFGLTLERALHEATTTRRILFAAVLLSMSSTALLLFPAKRVETIESAFRLRPGREFSVVRLIRKGVRHARRMVTSRQMYAYRLGVDIPPSQAVTSRKRFQRWNLSPKELVDVSLAFDPDVVVLDDRWPRRATQRIRHELRRSHALIDETGEEFVLARKTMMTAELRDTIKRREQRSEGPLRRSRRVRDGQ